MIGEGGPEEIKLKEFICEKCGQAHDLPERTFKFVCFVCDTENVIKEV